MMQWFVDDACRREEARIPIGYPLPGNRLALVDKEGGATPPGEVGETRAKAMAADHDVSIGTAILVRTWIDASRVAPHRDGDGRQAAMTDPESSDLDLRPDESRLLGEEPGQVPGSLQHAP
jgi:hypothetical protein